MPPKQKMKPTKMYAIVRKDTMEIECADDFFWRKKYAERARLDQAFPENWSIIPVIIRPAPKKRKEK